MICSGANLRRASTGGMSAIFAMGGNTVETRGRGHMVAPWRHLFRDTGSVVRFQ